MRGHLKATFQSSDATRRTEQVHAPIDGESTVPHGRPCPQCSAPIEPDDRFCPACGSPNHQARPSASSAPVTAAVVDERAPARSPSGVEPASHTIRCQNCGSEIVTDVEQRSYVCPFCDSTYVTEIPPDVAGRQRPEFIVGFAITPDQAQECFHRWVGENGWFRPGDLRMQAIAEKQRGVYLPFWSFSMVAFSDWSANIGEHWYRTETYTTTENGKQVTRTRTVQETEWWPLAGRHHAYYHGFLVSASRGLKQEDADRILPFDLPGLRRYEPYYLAGWLSEEYSVPPAAALALSEQEFSRREQQAIRNFLPGDTQSDLRVQSHFEQAGSDLCLLPVYVLSYRYRDRLYRFLVNGQTGRYAGDKPVSWRRILIAVGLSLALILILVLLVVVLQGGR